MSFSDPKCFVKRDNGDDWRRLRGFLGWCWQLNLVRISGKDDEQLFSLALIRRAGFEAVEVLLHVTFGTCQDVLDDVTSDYNIRFSSAGFRAAEASRDVATGCMCDSRSDPLVDLKFIRHWKRISGPPRRCVRSCAEEVLQPKVCNAAYEIIAGTSRFVYFDSRTKSVSNSPRVERVGHCEFREVKRLTGLPESKGVPMVIKY